MPETIEQLIINSPFEEPRRYWRYARETRMFTLEDRRRPAGYVRATPGAKVFDDPGVFVELPLANQIRGRVRAWWEAGYPGATGITRRLLAHWYDPEQRGDRPFFFCQIEAMETLIWLAEASPAERQGIEIPGDGGEESAATATKKLTKKDEAELLRQTVDTVGQTGKPGEQIEHVISVQMLSEGWDARTVTHIMGLRAFESQVLCEQVVGRGLRRTSYEVDTATGLYAPEYVNIFGVPFTFLPHEGSVDTPRPPQDPGVPVYPEPAKAAYEIAWPNVMRIEHQMRPRLELNIDDVEPLHISAAESATVAELAPILEGKSDITRLSLIELEEIGRQMRLQSIIFRVARDVYEQKRSGWQGGQDELLVQIIRIIERFIKSDRIAISPPLFNQDDVRRRILLTLNMNRVVQHIQDAIEFQNTAVLTPVFDQERPIRSTGDMRMWYTRKPREVTERSHINLCVFDSTWEASEAYVLDRRADAVRAWVKNDHLGFEIQYLYQGVISNYRPDFLARLANGTTLVLEVKGQNTARDQVKRAALSRWVEAVNTHGGFGRWAQDVSFEPGDVTAILQKHV